MFEIGHGRVGEVTMAGRLDATQCDAALEFLNAAADLRVIDMAKLDYIASAGLRVILLTQKRCKAAGGGVRLINLQPAVHDVFRFSGFDRILDIARAPG